VGSPEDPILKISPPALRIWPKREGLRIICASASFRLRSHSGTIVSSARLALAQILAQRGLEKFSKWGRGVGGRRRPHWANRGPAGFQGASCCIAARDPQVGEAVNELWSKQLREELFLFDKIENLSHNFDKSL